MYDTPFRQAEGPWQTPYPPTGGGGYRHGHGFIRSALLWTAVALVAMLALGAAGWLFGLVLGLFTLLVRVALVTAVVAFVWRRVNHRHHHRRRLDG